MKASYNIINEDGTVNAVSANYEINSRGCLTSFEGDIAFVPSNQGIHRIADGVFNEREEVHCEYFAKSFCDELEYSEVNGPFFALIRYASLSLGQLEIALKISGVTDEEEFEDIQDYVGMCDGGLAYISKVFYNEGPEVFGPRIIYDLIGVKSLYLPSTAKHINENAFAQKWCAIPRLESINVFPKSEVEKEDGFHYSVDGLLYYTTRLFDGEDFDQLIKVPAGKKEPCFVIPDPMYSELTVIGENAFSDVFFVNTISINSPCRIHPNAFDEIRNLKCVDFEGDGNYSYFAYSHLKPRYHPADFEISCNVDADDIIEYSLDWNVPISFKKN